MSTSTSVNKDNGPYRQQCDGQRGEMCMACTFSNRLFFPPYLATKKKMCVWGEGSSGDYESSLKSGRFAGSTWKVVRASLRVVEVIL